MCMCVLTSCMAHACSRSPASSVHLCACERQCARPLLLRPPDTTSMTFRFLLPSPLLPSLPSFLPPPPLPTPTPLLHLPRSVHAVAARVLLRLHSRFSSRQPLSLSLFSRLTRSHRHAPFPSLCFRVYDCRDCCTSVSLSFALSACVCVCFVCRTEREADERHRHFLLSLSRV